MMSLLKPIAAGLEFAWTHAVADRATLDPAGSDRLRRVSSRLRETTLANAHSEEQTVAGSSDHRPARGDRRMLWIDRVGGYLLSLSDEVVIGQPAGLGASDPGGPDVPVLADLSRRHARVQRRGGGYVIAPHGPTRLNDTPIDSPTSLEHGALITLGDRVQLRFLKPHALSATARLVFESGHRTHPSSDGVLLMAESCVLGPKPHSHVQCRHWQDEAILFRGAEGLLCRSSGQMTLNGAPAPSPAVVRDGARIEGQDFAMSIEPLSED